MIEPQALNELLPEWGRNPPPICVPVTKDEFWWLHDPQYLDAYARFGYRVVPDEIGGFAGPLAGLHACLNAASHPLVVTVPFTSPNAAIRIILTDTCVEYYVIQGGDVFAVDVSARQLDQGVYLLLAELAARA